MFVPSYFRSAAVRPAVVVGGMIIIAEARP